MRSIYAWQIRAFMWAFAILLMSQIGILSVGINAALNLYTRNELARLTDLATGIIINADPESTPAVEHSGPFFVFSSDKELIYSNRGKGRSISPEDYRPVRYDGSVVGYFYADGVRFLSSVGNRVFLASIGVLIGGSMLVSFGIAAIAAVRASHRVSDSVTDLKMDIETLRTLRRVQERNLPVTELSAMSSSLVRVSERLAGEEEYKRRWMQDLAHDLRTPISGLKSQLEGMRDRVLEPTPDRLDRTLGEIARLEEMITGINELHSIERTDSIEKKALAAPGIVAELHSAFEGRLRSKHMEFAAETDADVVHADRALLLRALGNIVENALSYAGEGARVHLAIREQAGQTIIVLGNNGPAIPEEHLPRVFERFYRGDAGRSWPGAGLGLNIVHEIITRHGGSIDVANTSPAGVEFTIRLPLA